MLKRVILGSFLMLAFFSILFFLEKSDLQDRGEIAATNTDTPKRDDFSQSETTTEDNPIIHGTIFLRAEKSSNSTYPYGFYQSYIVSLPERRTQLMGYQNDSAGQAISNDGKYLAITCENDTTSICILETSEIVNKLEVVPNSSLVGFGYLNSANAVRISLPGECVEIDGRTPSHQMSWSRDNSKLSVVCGSKRTESLLCIVGINGDSDCFPSSADKEIIYAVWSPKDDVLAVSSTTYHKMITEPPVTYLFDPETDNYDAIFSGFAPAWSPSGNRIASFFVYKTDPFTYGLQVYSIGTKKNTLALPNQASENAGFFVWPTVDESDIECTISWSSDEEALVFASHMTHFSFSTLFVYYFSTGEIEYLLDPDLLEGAQLIPQWSAFEITSD